MTNEVEKILIKIAKLKAHAESADKIGSEAEAQAFAAMVQKLMLDHQIQASQVDSVNLAQDSVINIIQQEVDYTAHNVKFRQRRVGWMEALARIVTKAYDCKFLISRHSNRIWLVGTPEHVAVAEYIFVYLVRTAEQIADKENKKYQVDLLRRGLSRGRGGDSGYRQSFLTGFCDRLQERLYTERKQQEAEAIAQNSQALVPVAKMQSALEKYMAEKVNKRPLRALGGELSNNSGYQRGQQVASSLNLNSKGITQGNPTTRKQIS